MIAPGRPALAAALALSLGGCAAAAVGLPPLLTGPTGAATLGRVICPDGVIPVRVEFAEKLTRRLEQRFPPGSNEAALVAALTREKFALSTTCTDHSVRTADYESRSGDRAATIYWQADPAGRMLWIGAAVAYTPL